MYFIDSVFINDIARLNGLISQNDVCSTHCHR